MLDSTFFPAAALGVGCALVSYLVCGIPFGKIIAKQMVHVDIQKAGSGNIGTTNALRVAGPKVAVLTLLCDVLKGVICVNLSRFLLTAICFGGSAAELIPGGELDWMIALLGAACLAGHIFSPYLHFKGGKGIAVGVGVLFAVYWPLALVHLAIFIVVVAATRYVSLGSILTVIALPLTVSLMLPASSLAFRIVMSLLAVAVVWAHRGNIGKLVSGTESKISFKGNGGERR